MTEETKNVALVVEGLPPVDEDKVKEIVEELSNIVKEYCGGEAETFILNSSNPEAEM